MWAHPGLVPDLEHDRGEGVGYRRAAGAQHAVAVDVDAVDVEFLGKVRGVGDVDLEEDDGAAVGDRIEGALFELLVPVFGEVPGLALVRNDVQLALVGTACGCPKPWSPACDLARRGHADADVGPGRSCDARAVIRLLRHMTVLGKGTGG